MYLRCSVFFLLATLIQVDKADEADENKIHRFFADRCKIYSTDATNYDNFMTHLDALLSYSSYASNLLTNDKAQFCHEEKSRLSGSMKQVLTEMSDCLPKSEKWLPAFLQKSFNGFLEFLCENNYKNIDNYFSSQGKSCRNQLSEGNAVEDVGNCFNKIFAPLKGTIRKTELCEDLDVAKKCFEVVLDRHCRDFRSFQVLNSKFFAAISKPCAGCMLASNTLLFAVLAGFIVKFFN